MDSVQNSRDHNSPCKEVQREPVVEDGGVPREYRVFPLFEKEAYEARARHRYSLLNNETMANRWSRRMSALGTEVRTRTVKEFPDINDYHFKNNRTQFIPALSYRNYKPPHFHLRPGPGTDKFGQRPIPIEMLLRKSESLKAPVLKKKTENLKKKHHTH